MVGPMLTQYRHGLALAIALTAATQVIAQRVQFGSTIPTASPYYAGQPITAYQPPTTYGAPPSTYAGTTYATGVPPATAPVLPYNASPSPVWDPYAAPAPPVVSTPPPSYLGPSPYIATPTVVSPYRTGGFYGAFEGAILKALVPGASQTFPVATTLGPGTATTSLTPDFDLHFSPRLYAGYRFSQGFGIRAGWWGFDDTADLNATLQVTVPPPTPFSGFVTFGSSLNIDVDEIDAVMTQLGTFHNWEYEVIGGLRYAKMDFQLDILNSITVGPPPTTVILAPAPITLTSTFEGVGPLVGVTGRRPIGFWEGLTFVGDARFSLLFGDAESRASAIFSPVVISGTVFNDTLPVWELRVGAEWSRALNIGAKFFAGAYLEGQMWDFVPYDTSFNGETGFFGVSFAVGLQR